MLDLVVTWTVGLVLAAFLALTSAASSVPWSRAAVHLSTDEQLARAHWWRTLWKSVSLIAAVVSHVFRFQLAEALMHPLMRVSSRARIEVIANALDVALVLATCFLLATIVFHQLRYRGYSREGSGFLAGVALFVSLTIVRREFAPAIAVFIGAAATVVVGVWNTNRQKVLEAKLRFVEQQLAELYGPLVGILDRHQASYDEVLQNIELDAEKRRRLAQAAWGTNSATSYAVLDPYSFLQKDCPESQRKRFIHYFTEVLNPLNKEIVALLSAKAHLVSPNISDRPVSFDLFVRHAAMLELRVLHGQSVDDANTPASTLRGRLFPVPFIVEVLAKFALLLALQNKYRTMLEYARLVDVFVATRRSKAPAHPEQESGGKEFHIALGVLQMTARRQIEMRRGFEAIQRRALGTSVEQEAEAAAAIDPRRRRKQYLLDTVEQQAEFAKRFDRFVRRESVKFLRGAAHLDVLSAWK
jgi:hypothetical protein